MECFYSFCNDQLIDINVRLLILEELRKSLKHIRDEDLMVLLVHKTNAVLTNCNRFDQQVELVDASSLENETKRKDLIFNYVALSKSYDHLLALISLLKSWPEFGQAAHSEDKPWNRIIVKLMLGNHSVIELANELKEKSFLDEIDLDYIRQELHSNEHWLHGSGDLKRAFLKLSFVFKNFKQIKSFVEQSDLECVSLINTVNPNDFENYESLVAFLDDKELMDLMMQEKSYLQLVNTPLYAIFFNYIVKNESKSSLNDVIKNLKQNGYLVEAAKLLAEVENFNDSHKTLSVSLSLLERFFGKF